jgi:TonB-linked SusC/RagA family outer membrane protein
MKISKFLMIPLFLLFAQLITAQKNTVSGIVTDENGQSIPGVNVVIKGSKTGVMTSNNGFYTINLSKNNEILVFSFIGYKTQEAEAKAGSVLNITLSESAISLNEVVSVGYGSIRKRDVTGAIVSLSGKDIDRKVSSNALEALQGQSAGVQIIAGSGQPGESASIRIRGTSTFNDAGVTPLYVVDGVPMDNIDGINPSDIESIEVLKDASSAAIYGSRSANGVILVSTKQGSKSKPTITTKYLHSWSALSHKLQQVTPAQFTQFRRNRLNYLLNEGSGYVSNKAYMSDSAVLNDPYNTMFNANNDYQDMAFKVGEKKQLDVSIGGGTDVSKYYFSTGLYNEGGIIPKTGYSRLTARLNSNYKASKRLTLSSKFSMLYGRKDGIDESGYLNALMQRIPNLSVYFPDETLVGKLSGLNPFAVVTATNFTQNYKGTFFQSGEYQILPNLKFTTNVNVNYEIGKTKRLTPSLIYDENQTSNRGESFTNMNWSWMNENYFNYSKKFKKGYNLSALAGVSIQEWGYESDRFEGRNAATDAIYTMNAFAANYDLTATRTDISSHSMASAFGRFSFDYKSRYLFNTNLRLDGSSRFAPQKKWGLFPSASFAWRLSDEKFMKFTESFLSDAKARVGYGITGNESIGDYEYLMSYNVGGIYDGISSLNASRIAIDNLSWEQTAQTNVGLDLRFLDNRFSVSADYYLKDTEGLLANYPMPKEVGFNSVRRNIGSIENRGWEISVNAVLIKKKDLNWDVSFNVATNDNRITKLSDGKPYVLNDQFLIAEGGRIGDFYGYQSEGVFQYNESNAFTADWQQLTPVFQKNNDGLLETDLNGHFIFEKYQLNGVDYSGKVVTKKLPDGTPFRGGDFNWKNTSGDTLGLITPDDKSVLANAQANFFGGFNTNIEYKSFTLSMSFYFSIGGKIYNKVKYDRNRYQWSSIVPTLDAMETAWFEQGDIANYPRPYQDNFQNDRAINSIYLEDASYIKLQNIKFGYNVPAKTIKKLKIKELNMYGYINNPLTWTAYSGFDPEFSTSSALSLGVDYNRYPKKRELGLGVNINF